MTTLTDTTHLSKVKVCRVVGVTFVPAYPLNLLHLAEIAARHEAAGERLHAELVRNPVNVYDPNDVEVHVPALGDRHRMIGHIARDEAALLAPRIDAGEQFVAEVAWCRVDPDHTDRPGIDIRIARILDVNPHSFTAADVTASLDDFANTIKSFNRFVRGLCSVSKLARLHRNGRLLARSRRNRRGR